MLRFSCRALLCMLLILCLGYAAAPAEEVIMAIRWGY